MTALNGLLFDLDGTLVDTLPDITAAANHALVCLHRPEVTQETVRRLVGRGAAQLLMRLLQRTDPNEAEVAEGVAYFLEAYEAHPSRYARAYEGIPELLQELAEVPKLVVTNKNTHIARLTLEQLDLASAFDDIYGSDAFPQKKPHPMPLLEGAKRLGLPCSQVAMIGDSRFDVEAGQAAGMQTLAVAWGFEERDVLKKLQPTAIFEHPAGLLRWLQACRPARD